MRKLLYGIALLGALGLVACDGGDGGADGGGGQGGSGGAGGDGGGGAVDPTVASVEPSSGTAGTVVAVRGAGFQDGAQVFFGTTRADPVAFVSATELTATAPAREGGGPVELTVRNPDGGVGRLANAFTYEGGGSPSLDWVVLQFPGEHTGEAGTQLQVFARAFEPGRTEEAGPASGLEAEVGVGVEGEDVEAWTWSAAAFNVQVDNDDEWVGTIALPSPGSYRYTLRFRLDGGAWAYADTTGSADGFALDATGRLTVSEAQPPRVDWCVLQFPSALDAAPGAPVGQVYGRAFEPGVTDVGDPAGVEAEVGVGPDGAAPDDPSWTWVSAAFHGHFDANDEHVGSFAAPAAPGSYDYAFRFRVAGGAAWTYCDLGGTDDGYDPSQAGTLTVAEPPEDVVDYAQLAAASLAWDVGAAPPTVEVIVYEAGVTEGAGQGGGIAVEIGHGPAGSDPSVDATGWTFAAAAYARDADGLAALANDVYALALPELPVGAYAYAARATRDGGGTSWIDADGSANGFDPAALGAATVREPAPEAVDWAILRAPATQTVAPGASLTVQVDVYEGGRTPGAGAAAGVEVEVGWAEQGADPVVTPFTWFPAPYARDVDGGGVLQDDQHEATFLAPANAGTFGIAARVRLDGGDWTYVDRTSTDDGFSPGELGGLVVEAPPPPTVDWCNLQFPATLDVAAGAQAGPVYGRVYEPGVTDAPGAGAVASELGFGPVGSDPAAGGWTFVAGTFNTDVDNGFGQLANDEHQATFTAPGSGSYDYAFRFSLDGGSTWTYCDLDGAGNGYDPAQAGRLTVQ